MTKQKDPAFLFYSKDWIEGTAELMPDEKGVFIDLLAHQHQKGSVPADEKRLARMVGLPLEDFILIWKGIKNKFELIAPPNGVANGVANAPPSGDRMVNRKLLERTTERSHRSQQNTIIGTFAHVLKKLDLPAKDRQKLKNVFKVKEIDQIMTASVTMTVTEAVTKWCSDRMDSGGQSIENANESKKVINTEKETRARAQIFAKEVREVAKQEFPKDMVDQFIKYWTEMAKSKRSFRKEDQKFFEIPKRLVTWYNKSDKGTKPPTKKDSSFN